MFNFDWQIDDARPIPPFRCEEIGKNQLAKEWKSWKSTLEIYFDAYDITDQRKMRAQLLHFGGRQLQSVFGNLPDVDKLPVVSTKANWYDIAVSKLDEYFEPGRQYILERCRLRKIRQEKGERFAHFVLRIRQQLADCGFEKYNANVREVLMEIFAIDVIVEGCASQELRRRILQKDVKLNEAEELGAMMEGVEQQVIDLSSLNGKEQIPEKVFQVNAREIVDRVPKVFNRKFQHNRQITCFNCGTKGHLATSAECKARNQACRRCNKLGHFEAVCRKRSASRIVPSRHGSKINKIRFVENTEQNAIVRSKDQNTETNHKSYYCFYFGNESNILVCTVGGVALEMLVDSGSDVNLIHSSAWEKLKQQGIKVRQMEKGCSQVIKGYGSNVPLRILGSFHTDIEIQRKCEFAKFFVVDEGQRCILGDATAKALGVLKIGVEVNQLGKAEQSIRFGKIEDVQVQIHMDPAFKPVFQPVRRVPLPYESAVNKKLDQLLAQDIIEVTL